MFWTETKTMDYQAVAMVVEELPAERELGELEQSLAEYVGAPHCILTRSGTAGLLMALKAAGVRENDRVLCTSFSFFATAEIIELAGAVPVLVDTNPETFNMDAYCLEYVLKKCLRTKQPIPKALVAADLFGLPCEFEKIERLCNQYNISLIEDMSCAFGASYNQAKAGSFGRFSVASFFPARPLGGIGDGGGVFCRNREDAKMMRALRAAGGRQPFNVVQANVIGEKLKQYDDELERRQLVAERYQNNLNGYAKVQQVGKDYISAYTQFAISLKGAEQREHVMNALREKHIPSSIVHCAKRTKKIEQDWERVVLANTRYAAERLLAVPMHPYLSMRVVDYICESIMETVEKHG